MFEGDPPGSPRGPGRGPDRNDRRERRENRERAEWMKEEDDVILAALSERGGAGTPELIKRRLGQSNSLLGVEQEQLERADPDSVDLTGQLNRLELGGLVRYLGHRVYTLTTAGNNYIFESESYSDLDERNKEPSERDPGNRAAVVRGGIVFLAFVIFVIGLWPRQCLIQAGRGPIPCIEIGIVVFLLFLSLFLYAVDRLTLLSTPLVRRYSLSRTDNKSDIEDAAGALANAFRSSAIGLLLIVLIVGTQVDVAIGLQGQIYGLVLDLFGGILLALEIFSTNAGNAGGDLAVSSQREDSDNIGDGLWGVSFLIIGFGIQISSLIPWERLAGLDVTLVAGGFILALVLVRIRDRISL